MKDFLASFTGQLIQALLPLILVGVVLWLAWRKLSATFFNNKTPSQVYDDTVQAAETIPSGAVSAAESVLLGQNDSTYITTAQQHQLAQMQLNKVLAGA